MRVSDTMDTEVVRVAESVGGLTGGARTQIVYVEEDAHAGHQQQQLPLDRGDLVLPAPPDVAAVGGRCKLSERACGACSARFLRRT